VWVCCVQDNGIRIVCRCALCKLPVYILCVGVLCASYDYMNCVSACSVQVTGIRIVCQCVVCKLLVHLLCVGVLRASYRYM